MDRKGKGKKERREMCTLLLCIIETVTVKVGVYENQAIRMEWAKRDSAMGWNAPGPWDIAC